jgi:hypothetical protein
MSPTDDRRKFEEIVASLIAEGLHLRRGMSKAEYTAACRKAWNNCQTSPGFERKVLIDPLRSVESMLSEMPDEYVHWRLGDSIELERSPETEITCQAVGAVRPDFTPDTGDAPPLADIEPDVPEIRRYLLTVFDILGFSAWLERVGLVEVESTYERLIAETVKRDSMRSSSLVRLNATEVASIYGRVPIGHAHFSDTIILWVPLVQHFIGPFMARCADLLCEALQMGVPLRGALAVGKAVLHERSSTFVGTPLVEAAKLEQAQDWVGASIGPSMLAADVVRELDPNLVLPFDVPFKKGRSGVTSGFALDWPRRYADRFGKSPIEALKALDRSPEHHVYYANAIRYIEYSNEAVFRHDSFDGPNLDDLMGAAIRARQSGEPLSRSKLLSLRALNRAGRTGAQLAEILRATAEGSVLPPIPEELPTSLKRSLSLLYQAADGKAAVFRPIPAVLNIVYSRLTGDPPEPETWLILDELQSTAGDGPAVSRFLRELAEGARPRVPASIRPALRSILRQAKDWIHRGEVPLGVLESVANDCCRAAIDDDETLSAETLRTLATIEKTGGHWTDVAQFLREISDGKNPLIPSGVAEPLRSACERLKISAAPAGVQKARVLDIMAIGIGDPPTDLNLWALVQLLLTLRRQGAPLLEEVAQVISEFESAASERRVIAECLRALITGADVPRLPSPSDLPRAVYVALLQIQALAAGRPVPVAPELVGLAAIHARFAERRLGDCSLLSLMLLANGGEESKTLADYLWNVARGAPAGPAPQLTDPELARTAEEVRILAMPEVGGIRMMFTRTNSPASDSDPTSG